MKFGIMFFMSGEQTADRYGLLKEAARFADANGFSCVWSPERHFHEFGGLFPNPSVTSAALAMITQNIQIRAGSVISPLHDPIRIAEEWAVVDNLSGGRVGLSFGSGWNINDFVLSPKCYVTRHSLMYEQINTIRELWRGGSIRRLNPRGEEVYVRIFPSPVQRDLPLWITSSGNLETFKSAGAIGANVLTHMLFQNVAELTPKIEAYREAMSVHGNTGSAGSVTLMLHTYLGTDETKVGAEARPPLWDYLRSALELEKRSLSAGGALSGGRQLSFGNIEQRDINDLLDRACDRYLCEGALIGTPQSCFDLITQLEQAGVDELACLIDFGLRPEQVMEGLGHLDNLRRVCGAESMDAARQRAISEFVQ
jgi:natural product biosynthesis luciferase-like monooxygenase protein